MSAAREFNCDFSGPIFRVGEILKIKIIQIVTERFEVDLCVSVEFETVKGCVREEQFSRVFVYEQTIIFVVSLPCRIKGYRRPF